MAKTQARRKRQPRRARAVKRRTLPLTGIALTLLAAAFLTAVFEISTLLLDRPIAAIDIEAPFRRVSALQIQAAIEPELGAGFLTASLGRVRERLEALAWVDMAVVRRRWPDRLQVLVVEQVPAARWHGSGLLNRRGELFVSDARHVPQELPRLSGPPGSAPQVAARYLAMSGPLIEAGLGLRSVSLDDRGAWTLTLTNGVEVRLGRQDVDRRIERFIALATSIVAQREEAVAFVDMRYANGFSIGWKSDDYLEPRKRGGDGPAVLASGRASG